MFKVGIECKLQRSRHVRGAHIGHAWNYVHTEFDKVMPQRLVLRVTRHTSHVTCTLHTSHVTRDTSHFTLHTSHVTRPPGFRCGPHAHRGLSLPRGQRRRKQVRAHAHTHTSTHAHTHTRTHAHTRASQPHAWHHLPLLPPSPSLPPSPTDTLTHPPPLPTDTRDLTPLRSRR
jgi:hypothetical protein